MRDIPRCLLLATYLTNEWSLATELCEDMKIETHRISRLASEAKVFGIVIELELGKVRLSPTTSIDQVKFAIK